MIKIFKRDKRHTYKKFFIGLYTIDQTETKEWKFSSRRSTSGSTPLTRSTARQLLPLTHAFIMIHK